MFRPRFTRAQMLIVTLSTAIELLTHHGTRDRPGGAYAAIASAPYVATKASSQNQGFGVTRLGGRRATIVRTRTKYLRTRTARGKVWPKYVYLRYNSMANGKEATIAIGR